MNDHACFSSCGSTFIKKKLSLWLQPVDAKDGFFLRSVDYFLQVTNRKGVEMIVAEECKFKETTKNLAGVLFLFVN